MHSPAAVTTVDGTRRPLPRPFMIITTQNLVESYGTFPLPNSQLDRFLISMNIGLPTPQQEVEILSRSEHGLPVICILFRLSLKCQPGCNESDKVRPTKIKQSLLLKGGDVPRVQAQLLGLQEAAHYLAGAGLGESGHEVYFRRYGDGAQLMAHVGLEGGHCFFRWVIA